MSQILLASKTAIITGASRVIGFEIGHALARAGTQFGLIDINAAEAEQPAAAFIR